MDPCSVYALLLFAALLPKALMLCSQSPGRLQRRRVLVRFPSLLSRPPLLVRAGCVVQRLCHLVALLQAAEDNPRGQDRQKQDPKVEAERDKVVGVALGLHPAISSTLDVKKPNSRPRDGLTQRLDTSQDTGVVRQGRDVGGVLPDEPVQELLERLSAKLPEEHERVRLAEAALAEVEEGRGGHVVELVLEDDGPDPGADEDEDDGGLA